MDLFASFGMPTTEDLIFKVLGVIFGFAGLWLEVNFISGIVRIIFSRDYPHANLPTTGPNRSRRFGRWIRERFLIQSSSSSVTIWLVVRSATGPEMYGNIENRSIARSALALPQPSGV